MTSFHYSALSRLREIDSDIRIGWLVREEGLSAESIGLATQIECQQLCPPASILRSDLVEAAHQLIPEIRVHHVLTIHDALRAKDCQCNGVTVNDPRWLRVLPPKQAHRR